MTTARISPADRWAWAEIDLSAIAHNTREFCRYVGGSTRIMAVVKANAYGHGAIACSRAALQAGASYLAVATVAEGLEIRDAGIGEPIVILSQPPIQAVRSIVAADLECAVQDYEFALALGECAASMDKIAGYHLAIDTGMTRVGVLPENLLEFRRMIDFHRGLHCAGTFTHFADAEHVRSWDFDRQLKTFRTCVAQLKDAGFDTGLIHADNSAGTIVHPEAHFDLCRIGIALYGLYPDESMASLIDLKPVMSVRARVIRTANPPVGTAVSYNQTYRISSGRTQILTLPIGYADGLSRSLSNRMEVLVQGRRLKQVGNICMDMCMCANEINPIRSYKPSRPIEVGEPVTIIGADGNEAIKAQEMADLRGTIVNELTCDFGMRLEKIYV